MPCQGERKFAECSPFDIYVVRRIGILIAKVEDYIFVPAILKLERRIREKMKNNEAIRIAIAETSVIIRGGLTAALKRLPNVKVQPIELLSAERLCMIACVHNALKC